MSLLLVMAKIGSKFMLSVSNFRKQRLKSSKVLAVVSMFVKLFRHAIAPLYLMEFLIKFVSGLGRIMSPGKNNVISGLGRIMSSFLLRPDFLFLEYPTKIACH